ncbi:MAG TPA: glycosyl hydrolase 108 family protein, partial [Gemmatimonadaceae bacterium]|nr:glycosyl hydrolase 108 family protein [Gemmatimonadaceae bacterium]
MPLPNYVLAFILDREGGYVNDPADPGGATNFGVTQAVFSAWLAKAGLPPRPVRDITRDEVRAIYERNYWRDGKCEEIHETHPMLALAHMDACV